MGFLADAFARKASSNGYALLREIAGMTRSSWSGKVVTIDTAVQVAAVMACVRVRANGLAQVPLKLMRESKDGKTRLPAKEHPLYWLLNRRPNDWQTSFEYREMLSLHLDLAGNHYSFINRSNRSGIMELIPFMPGSVSVKQNDDWTLSYEVTGKDGRKQPFPAKAIWHVRGPSWNSWMGLECVRIAREAIGLSMALEEQQARMQKNGIRASGTYSVEGSLKEDQYKALRQWIDDNYAAENAGRPMILDRGAKWLQHGMTNVDAQNIESRRFQVEEICRHFQVNPIMVFAESKNTTYASAEQQFLSHVVHTLSPSYMRIEQSIDSNLLTDRDREEGIYACFVDEGLLRGSMTDKKDTILGYVNGGVMTANEGRAKLDLNPDKDPASDKLRIPQNIAGSQPQKPAQPPQSHPPKEGDAQ
jgi:HK97 family phage portal protein